MHSSSMGDTHCTAAETTHTSRYGICATAMLPSQRCADTAPAWRRSASTTATSSPARRTCRWSCGVSATGSWRGRFPSIPDTSPRSPSTTDTCSPALTTASSKSGTKCSWSTSTPLSLPSPPSTSNTEALSRWQSWTTHLSLVQRTR